MLKNDKQIRDKNVYCIVINLKLIIVAMKIKCFKICSNNKNTILKIKDSVFYK